MYVYFVCMPAKSVFKKAGIKAKRTRFHIDLFIDVAKIILDDNIILYDNSKFVIPIMNETELEQLTTTSQTCTLASPCCE